MWSSGRGHVISGSRPFLEDPNAKFCIHSKQFVQQVMKECGLDTDKTYVFHGEWVPEKNAVIFMLKEQE